LNYQVGGFKEPGYPVQVLASAPGFPLLSFPQKGNLTVAPGQSAALLSQYQPINCPALYPTGKPPAEKAPAIFRFKR